MYFRKTLDIVRMFAEIDTRGATSRRAIEQKWGTELLRDTRPARPASLSPVSQIDVGRIKRKVNE